VGALGVLVFAVALLASIALHEIGHLVTAKRFGMKASRYFIGMGPTLWSTWRGETEYGVKAFPVGGFVKIVGMTQLEELDDPRDEPRAFWRQPAPQRAVVLAAGSAMHFVIAFVLLAGATLAFAQPKETTKIGTVADCLQDDPRASCAGQPPSPAKAAGIRPGDRVVAFEGREIARWQEFSNATHAHATGPAEVVVERDGRRIPLRVTVQRIATTIDGRTEEQGRIGVTVGEESERLGPVAAIGRAGSAFWELTTGSVKAMGEIPAKLPSLFRDAASDKPRSVTDGAPVSVVDLGRFSAQAFDSGQFVALIGMIAALNVFIGIFNLLPLLPLDGGHLAILVFEQVRSRIARALGRRDPGRVDLRKLMPAMVGFIVLMGSLTLVLIYAGITNPIANPFSGP
jgi:membrane-associated protease RseP (regulator of RpoE activity)